MLVAEGALVQGDDARRARYLLTVVNGLSIERALPAEETRPDHEFAALEDAVDALFDTGPVSSPSAARPD